MTTGRILAVCTGNVCRSPYIERRLQTALDESWGPGAIAVESAGTGALVDSAMDPHSQHLLEMQGCSAGGFRARQLTGQILETQQLVIVATREHRSAVARLWPRGLARIHTLLDLAQLAAQVQDSELPQRRDPRSWLDQVVALVASHRGLTPPLSPAQANVVDPFRQSPQVYARAQAQIEAALPHVLRLLGA